MSNVSEIREQIAAAAAAAGRDAKEITLLAVSKMHSAEEMERVMKEDGVTLFGENYVQELVEKYEKLHDKGARFHLIGHLQTNKVKHVVGKVELIQSVDSVRLADEISKQAQKKGVSVDCLIEVNVAGESSKTGAAPEEVEALALHIDALPNIRLCGLMAIPPFEQDRRQLIKYFKDIYSLFIDIKNKKLDNSNIYILSMGMSGDFQTAIECGSTMVRIGTAIFGERNYSR